MLAKEYRLTRSDNIPKILKQGDAFQASLFLAKYLPNRLNHHRFGIMVSQKVSKKSVERNTLRRRTYESIRLNLEKNTAPHYDDVVILPSKRALAASYQSINQTVIKLLNYLARPDEQT